MRIQGINFRIQPFDRQKHDRSSFSCGIGELDQYLQKQMSQDRRRSITAPFVLCREELPDILGYYTLSSMSIDLGSLPEETSKRLPRYPEVPATLIGRLAVDLRWRNMRLGEYLLLDALSRSWKQSHTIGAFAVIVIAKDDRARQFYARYDFRPFPDHPDQMFLPMPILKKIFSK